MECSNASTSWSSGPSRPVTPAKAGIQGKCPGVGSRVRGNDGKNASVITGHRNPQSGFMLIEVMVAATLLAVGVTAAMQAIYRSLDASSESQMYTRALFHAQKAMSEVENEVSFNDRYDVLGGWRSFDDAPNYEWRASISENDEFWVRRIIVSVRWAKNINDLHNDDKTYYYRLVTEVPMPRYPEDYER